MSDANRPRRVVRRGLHFNHLKGDFSHDEYQLS